MAYQIPSIQINGGSQSWWCSYEGGRRGAGQWWWWWVDQYLFQLGSLVCGPSLGLTLASAWSSQIMGILLVISAGLCCTWILIQPQKCDHFSSVRRGISTGRKTCPVAYTTSPESDFQLESETPCWSTNLSFMANANASWLLISAVICVAIVENIRVIVYRLYFHPLAHIPGPLLAGASFFYAYSYDMRGGRLYLQIPISYSG